MLIIKEDKVIYNERLLCRLYDKMRNDAKKRSL